MDTALNYTLSLTNNVENDLKIRKEYYKLKLKLLDRDVIAKEKIAKVLEEFFQTKEEDPESFPMEAEYLDENMDGSII